MRHPIIRAMHSYWLQLAAGRAAPNRTEVKPRDLSALLGHAFLLDSASTGHRFRLAGSRIGGNTGFDATNEPFSALFTEGARHNAERAVATAGLEGEPILIGMRLALPDRRRHEDVGNLRSFPRLPQALARNMVERRNAAHSSGEMVLLPLMHADRLGSRILGAAAFFGEPRERPAQPIHLEITGTRVLGRLAQRVVGTGLLPASLAADVVRRHGHLTLIQGQQPPE